MELKSRVRTAKGRARCVIVAVRRPVIKLATNGAVVVGVTTEEMIAMPQIDVSGYEQNDALAILAAHLFERLDTLNDRLQSIAESLEGIEKRLSYATALDNAD